MVKPLKKGDACGIHLLMVSKGTITKNLLKNYFDVPEPEIPPSKTGEVEADVKTSEPYTTKRAAKKTRKSKHAEPSNLP